MTFLSVRCSSLHMYDSFMYSLQVVPTRTNSLCTSLLLWTARELGIFTAPEWVTEYWSNESRWNSCEWLLTPLQGVAYVEYRSLPGVNRYARRNNVLLSALYLFPPPPFFFVCLKLWRGLGWRRGSWGGGDLWLLNCDIYSITLLHECLNIHVRGGGVRAGVGEKARHDRGW